MATDEGITLVLQVITAVLQDANDATELSLLYANQTDADILVRDELDRLAREHPSRFKVWYTVDRPPEQWSYSRGFITAEMIAERLPPPSARPIILMCGPPPMIKFACQANLEKLGYDAEMQVCF